VYVGAGLIRAMLRATSLDEVPDLPTVLRGGMGLAAPLGPW
jgi:lipopolysaccharide/colanic/teichoic acid biosynthesis glycosyltransferase